MKALILDIGNVVVRWEPALVFRAHFDDDEAVAAFIEDVGFFDWNLSIDGGRVWDEAVATLADLHPRHAAPIAAYRDRLSSIFGRFRDIVVSAEVGALKPDPAIFRLALARNRLEAREAIFVDDSPKNVEGARAVGLDAIRFTDAPALAAALRRRGLPA